MMDCNGCRLILSPAATTIASPPVNIPRARILWSGGRLYWATSLTDVQSIPMSVPPVKVGGGFKGQTDDGGRVRIQLPSCGCKKIEDLIGIPASTLIAAAKENA